MQGKCFYFVSFNLYQKCNSNLHRWRDRIRDHKVLNNISSVTKLNTRLTSVSWFENSITSNIHTDDLDVQQSIILCFILNDKYLIVMLFSIKIIELPSFDIFESSWLYEINRWYKSIFILLAFDRSKFANEWTWKYSSLPTLRSYILSKSTPHLIKHLERMFIFHYFEIHPSSRTYHIKIELKKYEKLIYIFKINFFWSNVDSGFLFFMNNF